MAGTLVNHEQFETLEAATVTASFRSVRVPAGIDGEVRELRSPLVFAIQRQALRVRVPRDAAP